MKNRSTMIALLASVAFAGLAGNAFALDGNDVLTKFNAVLGQGSISIKAASVDATDDGVTLKGASIIAQGGPEAGIPIGDVTMTGVAEDEGGYTIEKIAFADVNISETEGGVTARDISMNGVSIPAEVKPGSLDALRFYETIHSGPIMVTAKGKKVVSVEEINVKNEVADDDSSVDFEGGITGISADLSGAEDPKAKEAIEKLGLTTLNGEVTIAGSWTVADGKLDISEYAFDFDNVGRLDVHLGLSGYTLDFIKALQEATKAATSNPDKAAGQQAMGMAMMGLMQQLSFTGASIRFDDAGITPKALEYAGSMQGVDGKQMADSLKGMLPLMLGQLNMPDLATAISNAANTYLDDPKSIEVSSEPAAPIPFPQIMGAAMGAPQTLPQVLAVKITANE